jgi:hypothetical protein
MTKQGRLYRRRFGSLDHFRLGNIGIIDYASFRATTGTLILLDYDYKPFHFDSFASNIRIFRGSIRVRNLCLSRTTRGWHVIIEIAEKLTVPETIALQVCLGDDPRRGLMNFSRWLGMKGKRIPRYWKNRWNLLFSQKIL